jgi:hypothetical protein
VKKCVVKLLKLKSACIYTTCLEFLNLKGQKLIRVKMDIAFGASTNIYHIGDLVVCRTTTGYFCAICLRFMVDNVALRVFGVPSLSSRLYNRQDIRFATQALVDTGLREYDPLSPNFQSFLAGRNVGATAQWLQMDTTIETPVTFAREVAPIPLGEERGLAVNLRTARNIFTFQLGSCTIRVFREPDGAFISARDIVGVSEESERDGVGNCVARWLRKKDTIQCLIDLEQRYFPDTFQLSAAQRFLQQAGSNSFSLSASFWVQQTKSRSVIPLRGRCGDVKLYFLAAFAFAGWYSAQFKYHICYGFSQALVRNQGWASARFLAASLHGTMRHACGECPGLSEVINRLVFGMSSASFRDRALGREENLRDQATASENMQVALLELAAAALTISGVTDVAGKLALVYARLLRNSNAIDELYTRCLDPFHLEETVNRAFLSGESSEVLSTVELASASDVPLTAREVSELFADERDDSQFEGESDSDS